MRKLTYSLRVMSLTEHTAWIHRGHVRRLSLDDKSWKLEDLFLDRHIRGGTLHVSKTSPTMNCKWMVRKPCLFFWYLETWASWIRAEAKRRHTTSAEPYQLDATPAAQVPGRKSLHKNTMQHAQSKSRSKQLARFGENHPNRSSHRQEKSTAITHSVGKHVHVSLPSKNTAFLTFRLQQTIFRRDALTKPSPLGCVT